MRSKYYLLPTVAVLAGLASANALAHRPIHPLASRGHIGPYLPPYKAPPSIHGGTWAVLANDFPGSNLSDTALLMTDGSVMMHEGCTPNWYRLTPDEFGDYQNGTWQQVGSMTDYEPLYFASQVLADGRLIVSGGEYEHDCTQQSWSTKGAIYDPVLNKWQSVNPPSGWTTIGDAASVVLADGTYMLSDCCTANSALARISGAGITWDATGAGKGDQNLEEGWTMLPDETVLTVDASRDVNGNANDSEIYSPLTGQWTIGNQTVGALVDNQTDEIGPAPLLPNGLVFQVGATNHTGIYDPLTGIWAAGPDLPDIGGVTMATADGPAAVLPDGNILVQVSHPFFSPSHFLEIKVKNASHVRIAQVDEPQSAPIQSSFQGHMVVLPTGQVLWNSWTHDVEIYTPVGSPHNGWKPKIKRCPPELVRGRTYVCSGRRFNGLTFGSYYGDDVQQATNYPLIRITSADGHVCYARTHDHTTMGISGAGVTSTTFDVPQSCESSDLMQSSMLQVIANGIASAPWPVVVD